MGSFYSCEYGVTIILKESGVEEAASTTQFFYSVIVLHESQENTGACIRDYWRELMYMSIL